VAASDYGKFNVTVPNDPGLPLSGQTIGPFFDLNPNVASVGTDNHVRLAKEYGKQFENWQGVDFNMSARLGGGTQLQGGFSSGRQVQDNCDVQAKVPEGGVTTQGGLNAALLAIGGPFGVPFCHQQTPILTQVKGLATYTVPRVDVSLAMAFQSIPGPQVSASLVVPCGAGSAVASQLGRPCTASGGNVTLQIVAPGSLYEDRLNQFDFRVGKIIRLGGARRVTAAVDFFNLFNSSAVLGIENTYTAFRAPTSVVPARMAKFTATMQF
jgi:hypothetical protein